MRILLGQLEKSLEGHLYYLSLITALAVPDIAGALDAEDGQATGERYRSWYERWVRPRFGETIKKLLAGEVAPLNIPVETNPLDGDACYRFRCSLLHQGCVFRPIWALVPAGIWAVIPEDLGTLSERSDGSVRIGAKRRVEVKQLVGAGR
jgi:hypothetical protein